MTTQTPPLSSAQILTAQNQANAIASAISGSVVGSNEFVFLAAFDGTDNGANPPADGSGDSQTTAVRQMYLQVFPSGNPTGSGNIGGAYEPGVGTPGTLPFSSAWDVTVTAQSVINAQNAYNDFAAQATAWLATHPGGSLTSMITGFSRGGAGAAIFAQMLYENGLVNAAGQVLIPPATVGAVSAALIIDPVLTGVDGNMEFPPGVQNLTIVQAQNEYRGDFDAANYTGDNATVYQVTGNHGDAGDLYDNGLGGIYLQAYTSFFQNAGLSVAAVPSSRAYVSGTPVVVHSESQSASQILASGDFWDETYNSLATTDPSYLSVARQVDSGGVDGTPATVSGSATSFTAYNGDIVLSGTGGNYTDALSTFVLLPGSQATVTGSTDTFKIGNGAALTYDSSSNDEEHPDNIVLGNNASLTLNGSNAVIIGSNDSITLGANASDVSILGTGNTIRLNPGAAVSDTSADLGTDTITFDTTGSDALTLDADSFAAASEYTDSGTVSVPLTMASGGVLGTLSINTSTGADSFTLADGLAITLPVIGTDAVTVPGSGTDAVGTLVDYLADLGDSTSASALNALNFAYLNPTGTSHTVTGSVSGTTDTFVLTGSNNAPGAQITGVAGDTNILQLGAASDLAQDTISGIETLQTFGQTVTLTHDEFTGFTTINNADGSTIVAADGGTFDINSVNTNATAPFNLAATSLLGTTLVGNNVNGQVLEASPLGNDTLTDGNGNGDELFAGGGNDTLTVGNGTGDALVAGTGVDTLIGGTGGDVFVGASGNNFELAPGSTITGSGTGNTLGVNGDISGDAISDIQTLNTTGVTLTAAQFAGFSTIDTTTLSASTLNAAGAGTYDLNDVAISGLLNLSAATTGANATLIGNGQDFQILTGGAGNDTLTDGDGTADELIAGSGNSTLTAGNGAGDTLTAGSGNDTLTAGNGAGDLLIAGTGVDTLIGGTGGDTFSVNGLAAGSTITGTGTGNTLSASGDISGDTISGIQTLEVVGSGDVTLTAAQFNGFSSIVGEGSGTSDNGTINATTAGTYNLGAKDTNTVFGFNMTALSNGGTTLIGSNADGETLTASATGNDTLEAGSGNNEALVAGGGTDTLVGGTGSDFFELNSASLAGDVVSFNSGQEQIVFTDPTTVVVQGGTIQTVIGADGTMTVNDSATAPTNTIDWNAGGSEVETFAFSGGNLTQETDTGYTGANGAGSVIYTQTTTHSGGSTGVADTGQGATSGASSATVTLAAGASATLLGSYDTVSVAAGDTLAMGGASVGDSVAASGADTTVTDAGNDSTITMTGTGDATTLSGSATVDINGGGETASLTGFGSVAIDNGTGGNTISLAGSSNGAYIHGDDDTASILGSNDYAAVYGTGNSITIGGTGEWASLFGSGNTVDITGAGDTAYDQSAGDNTITMAGNTDYGVIYAGSGDTINVEGGSEAAIDDGVGNCAIYLTGSSDSAYAMGNGDTLSVTGTNDYAYDGSTGSITMTIGGSSNSAVINGSGDTVNVTGTGDSVRDGGSGNTTTLGGSSNTVILAANNDTADVSGSNNTADIYASGDTVNATGTGAAVFDGGSGNNTIILNGSSETGTIYNNSGDDALTVGGTGNSMTMQFNQTGSGTATLSGTNALLQFDGASADAVTFTDTASAILKLNDASSFAGTVAGLADGDAIDLANFLFSGTPTISSVTGSGAAGTATDVTVHDGSQSVTLALLNQFGNQFAVNASAYTLAADSTAGNAGTLLQLAASH